MLPKGVEGTSKSGKASKRPKKVEQLKISSYVNRERDCQTCSRTFVKEVRKEVVPSKVGVFKKTKKPAHRPHHSPERRIIEEVVVEHVSSPP